MGSRWDSRAALALAAAVLAGRPAGAAAQGMARATPPRAWELGLTGIATASDPALVVGGGSVALRTSRRTRVAATLGAGVSDGRAAWRGELLVHFLLSPARQHGVGLYAGGGVAAVGGSVDQGYLVLVLGLDARPGGRSGWFVDAGVGGGGRLAVGYRWRHRAGRVGGR